MSGAGTAAPGDSVSASEASVQAGEWGPTDLLFFWGDGCPHCAAEQAWLDEVRPEYPAITIHEFEVWHDEANRAVLLEVAQDLGFDRAACRSRCSVIRFGWDGPISSGRN